MLEDVIKEMISEMHKYKELYGNTEITLKFDGIEYTGRLSVDLEDKIIKMTLIKEDERGGEDWTRVHK